MGGAAVPFHPEISRDDFQVLRDLIYQRFGINLGPHKRSLVVGRLGKVLRQRGFADFGAYYKALKSDQSGALISELVDRISTNHTYFFREAEHFRHFTQTVLPELKLLHQRDHDLRLWCAAAATGEEPYTIAMLIDQALAGEHAAWQAGLLATDISDRALQQARTGRYVGERLNHVPPLLRQRYFTRSPEGLWEVLPALRAEVTFRRLNLIGQAFRFRQPFDVIFCRNVMIYFDLETRTDLLRRLAAVLRPGGYLYIGHSETVPRDLRQLRLVQPAVYRHEA